MPAVEHVESADGTRIAYRAEGDGDPIVFVHGAVTSGIDWLLVMPMLRDRFRVVIMDRRGRGESGDGPGYAIEREAEDVLAVLDATDAAMLVGHSYGAMCSILAAEQTDRLRRLVLYEPPISASKELAAAAQEIVAKGDDPAALELFLRGTGMGNQQFETIRSSPAWDSLLTGVPALPRELQAASTWNHPDGQIDVPTLFLLTKGNQSPAFLTGLDELLSRFSNLERAEVTGPVHVSHLFAAEEFAELVADFCGQ